MLVCIELQVLRDIIEGVHKLSQVIEAEDWDGVNEASAVLTDIAIELDVEVNPQAHGIR